MKFLIDAHLPPGLRGVFEAAGHNAIHTMDLPQRNAARDGVLNEVSMRESRVLVTKDTDFYYSHLLHGRPEIGAGAHRQPRGQSHQADVRNPSSGD